MPRALLTILALVALPCLVWAADPTEAEQRAACTSDVFRLCLLHVPDRERISQCMVENRTQLTPACRQVVDASTAAKRRVR